MDRSWKVYHHETVHGGDIRPNARASLIAEFEEAERADCDSTELATSPATAARKAAENIEAIDRTTLSEGDVLVSIELDYEGKPKHDIYLYVVRKSGIRLESIGGGRL